VTARVRSSAPGDTSCAPGDGQTPRGDQAPVMPRPIIIPGASLMKITVTPLSVIVGCPGCGALESCPLDEEPVLEHATIDCPLARTLVHAFRLFIETREVRG
jgi:hypothetical protein